MYTRTSRWTSLGALALIGAAQGQSVCNGHAELCDRLYSNVSFVGAHNSYSVRAGSLAANQNWEVGTQLDNGIRMLQGQGHNSNGVLHLCHTSCSLLDAGTLQDYLTKVKTWLDANPNEVVSALWVNIDNVAVSQWAAVYAAVGLDTYSYSPPSTPVTVSEWPTLQSLISSNKRFITFIDNGADYSESSYILDEFTHMWETPYDVTENSFPCTVDRGSPPDNKMMLINHFLDVNITLLGQQIPVPDKDSLNATHAVSGTGSLGLEAETCAAAHGTYPNFMLVDYYDVGDGTVFEVAAKLNDVQYTAIPMGNGTTLPTDSSSSGSTNSTPTASGNGNTGSIQTYSLLSLALAAFTSLVV